VNLISDALPGDRLWYGGPSAVTHAIDYAMHRSPSHDAVIRFYDAEGNVIETQKEEALKPDDSPHAKMTGVKTTALRFLCK